ncbi:MAG: phosphatase PAP2 family protein [Halanaeroarchaeum sp.]
MRGIGVTAAITRSIPEAAVPLLLAVTALGDPVFVAVLATLVYWVGPRYDLLDRREGAAVVAATYVALAATLLLKTGFSLPRPPASVMLIAEDGAGFPSGHATGATATYAALAVYLERGRPRVRYALGVAAFAIVAASRVLLGVHYLVDVVAGIAVGLAILGVVRAVARESLTWAFAMAVPLALGGALLHATVEAALQVGLVTGAAVGWWLVRDRLDGTGPARSTVVLALVGGGLLAGAGYESGMPIVAGFTGLATGALFLALPALQSQNVSR